MFNLIVAGGATDSRRGSIISSRVFEYTNDKISTRFKPNGKIDVHAVMELPTLFMEEGIGTEIARFGWLNRVQLSGNEYQLQYIFDPDIPALTNAEVYEMAAELQIHEWEFSRNHWAIKETDLTYSLLKRKLGIVPRPTVFQLSQNPVNPKLVSLMMPFSQNFDRVHLAVKTAVEAAGCICKRVDDFWHYAHIMHDIIELICTSGVVICDLSERNANVLYEAGIAHTLGKEVILITQSMDDVPFDLRPLRCIRYLNNNEGCAQLAEDIAARIRTVAPVT